MAVSFPHLALFERLSTIDPEWERPTPPASSLRKDVWLWLAVLAVALGSNLIYESLGIYKTAEAESWKGYLSIAGMSLPLIWRRRYPVTMLLAGTVLFYCMGFLSLPANTTLSFQLMYLMAIYSALAWAPDRKAVWIVFSLVCLSVLVWLVTTWTINGSLNYYGAEPNQHYGPLDVPMSAFLLTVFNNSVYFGSGAALGRVAWQRAYQQSVLQEQAEQIQRQSRQMAQDAVTRERLRIARELHDSVGHQMTVMGIQSAAARKLRQTQPELSDQALKNVEEATRGALGEMKTLLRLLRQDGADPAQKEPQIADIPALARESQAQGLTVDYLLVEHVPGASQQLSQGVQLSVYRIVQESLNNIHKHSTARSAQVALRTFDADGGILEIEVTDDGRQLPYLPGTSNGFGLQGIRERAETLGGLMECGRRTGAEGWYVRVRIPIGAGER